jgi:aryl-alcohol dehydrogenase-like predicted oxidoreductase
MEHRKLGRTDVVVSTICLGCWALIGGGTWGPQDRRDSVEAIRAAADAGITFFDTAPAYGDGESESLVGEALGKRIDEMVVATKVSRGELAPDDLRASCERSLKLLGAERIDLLQIHWPNPDVPLADTLDAMQRLRDEGKIGLIGVSNFGPDYLADAMDLARVESNQVSYSLLWRPIEHEIRPMCVDAGMSVLPYSPLCQGLLTGKFRSAEEVPDGRARSRLFSKDRPESRHQEPGAEAETFRAIDRIRAICREAGVAMNHAALAWLLRRPGVPSVIAGARNPEQARSNAAAGDVTLSDDVLRALTEATAPVKAKVGANADMWQTDSRMTRG